MNNIFGEDVTGKLQNKCESVSRDIMISIELTADALVKFKDRMQELKNNAVDRYGDIKKLVNKFCKAVTKIWNNCVKDIKKHLKVAKQKPKGKWEEREEERAESRNKFQPFYGLPNQSDQ